MAGLDDSASKHRVVTGTARMAAAVLILTILGVDTRSAAAQSGKQDYEKNCAVCHGSDGKGNGPALQTIPMNPPPPDLTQLTKNNGGKFPFGDVVDTIDGRKNIPSHERLQMPGNNSSEAGPGVRA